MKKVDVESKQFKIVDAHINKAFDEYTKRFSEDFYTPPFQHEFIMQVLCDSLCELLSLKKDMNKVMTTRDALNNKFDAPFILVQV